MSRGVRLSSGVWRGRRLEVAGGVRPTEGRVREALLSIWQDRLPSARVLDLFAGSGAVGLEALGRGASEVVLVDRSSQSLAALKRNCRLLGAERVAVRRLELPKGLARLDGPFDLIFADPPYDFEDYESLIDLGRVLLSVDGELVVEHDQDLGPSLPSHGERRYGGTRLSFFDAP